MKKEEFRILSATAILGYGFPLSSFEEGLKRNPHVIAVDAGSTDPGPYYLGAGVSFTDRDAVKRDLGIMIKAGVERGIPVCIGTAGGSGGEPHINWNREIVDEIAKENGLRFKLAIVHAEIPKDMILRELAAGRITPLGPAPALTADIIGETTRIVAQMGIEPFIAAREGGAQVILAGRAYDPAVFSSLAVAEGYDRGLATHLGKILECAAICATPGSGSDCMFGYIGEDYFRVEPLNSERKCTTVSVAAHTLYEKSDPRILPGPGGYLDLTEASFEQETPDTVRVSGSKFVQSDGYFVKLEGAHRIGWRTISIAGTRDAIMTQKIDEIIAGVKARVADNFSGRELSYHLNFIIYGRDGVMGKLEPLRENPPSHEFGIIIEAIGDTQELANTICATARSTLLHYGFEGRRATAGNIAFPYSPSDFEAGEVFAFSVYHLLKVDDPAELFPIEYTLCGQ
ncbi:MAG: DUF1446 domain-containing protein [Oscillospiraceae bacterium]|nr:DUF1446 domain-containing protein [Oscillospiraceae bacterium]